MIVLGLTGSIGMGKSTTAGLFRDEGVPVQDADQVVAELYAEGGAAVGPVGAAFSGVIRDGAVDRAALSKSVLGDPGALKRLEALVHPLVKVERDRFLSHAAAAGAPVAVVEVPLLFEVGASEDVDAVVVASASLDHQRQRVLARPGMTEEKLTHILARQTPDADKRARADFVIDTSRGIEAAREQVRAVLDKVRSPQFRPRGAA
ncbi:MAG: dephospho-CoA kinase [Caulobacteraceae bacterium]